MSVSTWAAMIGLIAASAGSGDIVSGGGSDGSRAPFLPQWPIDLQHDVVGEARRFPGEFAFVVKDLQSGATYTYNGETPMYLASGIKIPVLVALFQMVRDREIRLTEELEYTGEDVRDGSPLLTYLRTGTPISLRVLAEAMIQRSDNAATDMLINRVGIARVNDALEREGLRTFGPITTLIDVRRIIYKRIDPRATSLTPNDIFTLGVTRGLDARMALFGQFLRRPSGTYTKLDYSESFAHYYRQGYNSAPLAAMAELLEGLARGEVVSPAYSAEIMDIMAGTQTGKARLRAGLPSDIRFAHKTGSQFRRTCDFGVVFMPDGRQVVMTVVVKGGRGRSYAEALMARLARRAYWHLATPVERQRLRRLARVQYDDGPFEEDQDDPEDMEHAGPTDRKARRRLR